ncbi:MAG: hypothetical protein IPM74_02650 [Crocinitomicaceae bacterium]|nr:hypothetical protein [Crocinitomicaceae bacterium]
MDELRKQADALFEEGKFIEATPLYSKILAQQPRDYEINFRYGTCLLYNSHNKEEALKYLTYAVKGTDVDKRVYYYLGRAYHLNYQFNEAIIQYEKFKSVATPNQLKDLAVDQQILACKNGKKLLGNITDIIVIQKTEIKAGDFYELYKLNNIGGTILVTDEFQSKIDKQKGHRAIIHFPSNATGIYYSSYGEDGNTGLDIYVRKKLPDGKYGSPQKVQGGVNTGNDEDYAYMHPDGKYLYFCSKGHNSMGGYDVFRCAYDPNTNTFGQAENLDFAISSPDDDLFFVVDSLDRNAYFASARESQDGKLFVYEVRVDRIPLQIAVIKGSFVNNINPANKVVSIVIKDFSTGATVGTFNSKEANGDYLITFPKPGKYKYEISVKGSEDIHIATVEVPYQKDFKPLKQRITVKKDESGQEYVMVENLFGEEFDDPIAVLAEIYKEMSELMPNADKYDLDSLDELNKGNEVFTEAGLDPFVTKEDVEKVVEDEIKDLQNGIAEDEKNAAIAYHLAEEKNDSANAMMVEINKKIDQAENETDPVVKNQILTDVAEDTKVVERLNEESKNLIALGNEIDESIEKKENQLESANQVQQDLNNTPDGNKNALGEVVTENKTFFDENVKNNHDQENVVENIISSNVEQNNTSSQINNEIISLNSQINTLEKQNQNLQEQADNTKNKKDKEALEQKILANEQSIEELKIQVDQKEKEYAEITENGSNSSLGTAANIVDNPRNATPENTEKLSDTEKNQITNKVDANNLDANLAEVNRILDENNIGGPALNLFASDETTNNYSLQQWNEAIDKEIDRLNVLKLNASPEEKIKIDQEIQKYEDLREEKIQQFNVVEDPTKIQPEINPDDIVTGYTAKQNEINKIADEEQRRSENLKLQEEYKGELLKEKAELERLLDENPGNKNIGERIENIDKKIAETDTIIANDKKWLAENSGTVVVDTEEVVASVDPGYQEKINAIYSGSDENKRNEEMKALNESFIEKSNERIQELNATLSSDPNNMQAKAELDELNRLNSQAETNPNDPLIKPVVLDIADIQPKVNPDQILENYTERKNEINGIVAPYQRKSAENTLNKELSNEIREEIVQLNQLLEENPGNKVITERLNNLKKLDDELNSTIVTNEKWMQDNPQNNTVAVDDSDVNLVNPDYQAEVNRIDKIQDPTIKSNSIEDLNNQTLEKIDEQLNEVNQILAENPNDVNAQTEKEELTQMKNQIQENPDQLLTEPENFNSINTRPTIGEIMPDYQNKMDNINGSSQPSIEKEKDKIELNTDLVSLIDNEIKTLTDAKTSNPSSAKDIDKRIQGLNTIKTEKLAEIETSENKINQGTGVDSRPAITINSVMPDYDKKMADIEKKNLDEKSELSEKNGVNNQLISAIDAKIADLEKEKTANPSNAAAIDKDIQTLQSIKSQKENEIRLNNERISQLESGDTSLRPAITINSVMPDYDKKMADIEKKNLDEKSELSEKNGVNNQLISAIDSKIADLEKEKTANPSSAAAIDKDIQTLQSIKSHKRMKSD